MRRLLVLLGTLSCAVGQAASNPYPGITLVDHPEGVLAVIDLCAAGVSIRATRYDERRATPQQWGQAVDAELAINGDFFDFPGWSWVVGRARGAGQDWPPGAQQQEADPFWQFGPGFADFEGNPGAAPRDWAGEIMGARDVLISGGVPQLTWPADDFYVGPHKRSAIGISADHQTLFLISTRVGVGFGPLAQWMAAWAAEVGQTIELATNNDGGGSSQLYVKGLGQLVDSGRQVNNHLGVYAKGIGTPNNCRSRSPRSSGNVASWSGGRLDVFTWDQGDGLGHRGFGGQWFGWDALGPALAERPVVTSWGPNRLDVFTVAPDRSMMHRYWGGASFSGWEALGGDLASEPAVTSWGPNRLDVFAVGASGAMFHKAWTGVFWTGWEDLGGHFLFKPAVVAWSNNRLDVFAVSATDRSLQHLYWNGTAFSAWEGLGGSLDSAPAAVAWGFNRLDVFAATASRELTHLAWTGTHWGTWDALGGSVRGDPSVVAWGPNRLDVFALGDDGTMGHLLWDGTHFSGWEPHPGQLLEAPVAVAWESNRLDVFSVGADHSVVHKFWSGVAWSAWESLGGGVRIPPVAPVLAIAPETASPLAPGDQQTAEHATAVTLEGVTGQCGCSSAPFAGGIFLLVGWALRRNRDCKS